MAGSMLESWAAWGGHSNVTHQAALPPYAVITYLFGKNALCQCRCVGLPRPASLTEGVVVCGGV